MGFIDDDFLKIGKKLLGFPVLGNFKQLSSLVKEHQPHGVLVSFVNPNGNHLKSITETCEQNGLFVRKFAVRLADIAEEQS